MPDAFTGVVVLGLFLLGWSAAAGRVSITLAAIKNPCWGDQFEAGARNRELERWATGARDLLGPELIARIPGAEALNDRQHHPPRRP